MMLQQNSTFFHLFFQTFTKVCLYPGRFFGEISQPGNYMPPLYFLLICGAANAMISTLLLPTSTFFMIFLYFLNAVGMPIIMASLLFGITHVLFKGSFERFRTLFSVTAYSNVTALFSWMPGISWIAVLWNFYLIGVGMVKAGHISGLKAFFSILTAVAILAALLEYAQPMMK